ncbi:MAG: tetratricopeptide repeat protein [Acidobacteria bacterium]|nr:tetratricopeptide repeat protein [Acidobacteriota bacterium]
MSQRLETLRSLVEQDPTNAFTRYGLAMELSNSGQLEDAVAEFRALLAQHPEYVAGYYHCGRACEALGRREDARTVYTEGVSMADRLGNEHARGELEAALGLLA